MARKIFTGTILSLLCVLLCHPGGAEAAKTLQFASYFPTAAKQSQLLEEFCKEVEERTNGEIKINFYGGGSLLGDDKVYDGVTEGMADIGFSHIEYTRGRFPVTELLDLPLGYPSAWVATHVVNDFFDKYEPKEWDKSHVLWLNTSPVNSIITRDTRVEKLEDMQDLSLRGPGIIGEVVKALGASPKPVPLVETYDAISRGVVDGSMTPIETLFSFRLAEAISYVTNCWQASNVYTFYVIMNKNTWDGLSAEHQNIFTEISEEYIDKAAEVWNEVDVKGYKQGKEEGVEFINLSAEEMAKWEEAVQPVIDEKVEELVKDGFSEDEVKDMMDYVRGRTEYWTEKQIEKGIKSPTGPEEMVIN
ncbi:MAG: TRAP transporter substrate-binding protein [Thermodesulfobacteriota bacterium]